VSAAAPERGANVLVESKPTSLGAALHGRSNSLGVVRLVLALLVIVDHAFPLGGFGIDPVWELTRGQASLGLLAVGGFFAISGYLIAKSGLSGDVLQFLWRRFLRIFPAFWVVLLLTSLVVAPILWVSRDRDLASYFAIRPDAPLGYLTENWTLHIGQYGIGEFFIDSTPYGEAVNRSVMNGSLWTLAYEWSCYLLIGVLMMFGVLVRARILVPIITGLLILLQLAELVEPQAVQTIFPMLAGEYRVSLTLTFMVGACLALYSRSIPFDDRLGLLSALVLLGSLRLGGFAIVGVVAGAYFVIYLGARLPASLQWIGSRNDYSYGIYIYGFLVQQVTAYLGWYRWGYVPYVLIAVLLTCGFAWLSWHGIEKRAMALKSWGPGRGLGFWLDRFRLARSRPRTPLT